MVLTGVNSSHPLLPDLLTETLGLPVVFSRFNAVTGLAGVSMGGLLLQSGLGRLIGLALGLLPSDQLLACSLEEHALNVQESQPQNDALAIADLLRISEAQRGLDLVAVEADPTAFLAEKNKDDELSISLDSKVENLLSSEDRASLNVVPQWKLQINLMIRSLSGRLCESSEFSSGLPLEDGFEVEPTPLVLDHIDSDTTSLEEWPSIDLPQVQNLPDLECEEVAECSEEQWPEISGFAQDNETVQPASLLSDSSQDFSGDELTSSRKGNSSEDTYLAESEWPSIASQEPLGQSLGVAYEAVEEPSAWPSIASENNSLDVAGNFSVTEDFSTSGGEGQQQLDTNHARRSDDQNNDSFIHGLKSQAEVVDQQKELTCHDNEGIGAHDSSQHEVIQELGELRFADED